MSDTSDKTIDIKYTGNVSFIFCIQILICDSIIYIFKFQNKSIINISRKLQSLIILEEQISLKKSKLREIQTVIFSELKKGRSVRQFLLNRLYTRSISIHRELQILKRKFVMSKLHFNMV